jgi:hypothetical protein
MTTTEENLEDEGFNFFTYLEEADFQKPIWSSYCREPRDVKTLMNYFPATMGKHLRP